MVAITRRKFIYAAALLVPGHKLLATAVRATDRYFLHGVASGDPLQNSLIIWTRVTDVTNTQTGVTWEMAADQLFKKMLQSGISHISEKSDYTVKVDVKQLLPGTTYYYRFKYRGIYSPIGTTKTLPGQLGAADFKMAVISCNNWEDGYFNAFRFIAQKPGIDLVLHLGDYIYEYKTGEYGNPATGRINEPRNETITLADYRKRYAQYHEDPDLQMLHAAKPWYLIWDDHELANDAYLDGAKNHQSDEGPWEDRKKAAVQAYLEWLPVRAKKISDIRRKFTIGDDISLFLMDQRTTGRTVQMESDQPGFQDKSRGIIGNSQYEWLAEELKKSKSTWNLIGNQVMFSGYAVAKGFKLPKYNDWWLGYPYERGKIIDMLEKEKIRNTVFLTGDHHESFVLALHKEEKYATYTKDYHQKPLAWELLTPSITSRNGDRQTPAEISAYEEMLYRKDVNPHLVFGDIKGHGYFIAAINKKVFTSTYYFTENLLSREAKEIKAGTFTIDADSFQLS